MNKIDSMSAAVREVIDAYPAEHEFYGNQLKDDVVKIYPDAVNMYPDTILRMARRHRRYAFCVVNQNNSLYKKVEVIPITEQIKEAAPKCEQPIIIRNSSAQPAQGLLFAFMLFALFPMCISHNSVKTAEPLSIGIVKSGNIFRFPEKSYVKSLSLPIIRRDYFSMSDRANIRQPGTPATELRSVECEGVLYDDEGRKAQKSS